VAVGAVETGSLQLQFRGGAQPRPIARPPPVGGGREALGAESFETLPPSTWVRFLKVFVVGISQLNRLNENNVPYTVYIYIYH